MSVEDAAGNRRSILESTINVLSDPTRRQFDSQGVIGLANPLGDRPGTVPNGSGADRAATLTSYVRGPGNRHVQKSTATYPRASTVVGRLTNAGQPIVGAIVSVLEREAGSGIWRSVAARQTSRTGTVIFQPAGGPSRQVRFACYPDSEATTFVSSPEVELGIRPRVVLRASRRALQTGQLVHFTGRVRGLSGSPQGTVVSLQAGTARSRWITFRVRRTNNEGIFRTTYRFTNTRGRVNYRFRAVVPKQAGQPFVTGRSPSVWVRVSG